MNTTTNSFNTSKKLKQNLLNLRSIILIQYLNIGNANYIHIELRFENIYMVKNYSSWKGIEKCRIIYDHERILILHYN